MKIRMPLSLSLLVILMMACSLSGSPGPNTGAIPTEAVTAELTSAPTPTAPPDPVPVSINDGLASLNSYQMTMTLKSVGPDPAQSSTTGIETQHSSEPDTTFTHYTSSVVKPDSGEPDVSDSTTYRIGNDECSGSDQEGWEWASHTPAETEMQGLVTSMIGVTPIIDDPVFVAAETVNGVPTNHFNFKVSGLGSSSGAVVNINQGDYWLAVDGQYMVKYLLILEMSQAADSEVLHQEMSIELSNVNGPVSIAFPQGCLDVAPQPTTAP